MLPRFCSSALVSLRKFLSAFSLTFKFFFSCGLFSSLLFPKKLNSVKLLAGFFHQGPNQQFSVCKGLFRKHIAKNVLCIGSLLGLDWQKVPFVVVLSILKLLAVSSIKVSLDGSQLSEGFSGNYCGLGTLLWHFVESIMSGNA